MTVNKTIKLRARETNGVVTVKSIISHPMETGLRKNRKTGKKIPARYIREVAVEANGTVVMEAYWGNAISRNPYLSFRYPGSKGDSIKLSWIDNVGDSDSVAAWVK